MVCFSIRWLISSQRGVLAGSSLPSLAAPSHYGSPPCVANRLYQFETGTIREVHKRKDALDVCLELYRNHSKHTSSSSVHAVGLASTTGENSRVQSAQTRWKEIEMKRFATTILKFRPTASQLAVIGFSLLLAAPAFAQAANSPWENAVNVLQTAFTSTIARGLSLVAIVVAGLTFAFGEGGSKKVLAGVLFGVGMAIAAVNFIAWLFPGA